MNKPSFKKDQISHILTVQMLVSFSFKYLVNINKHKKVI